MRVRAVAIARRPFQLQERSCCLSVHPDKKLKRSGKKKSPTRSLVRLKFLQKYCNKLLSCDPRVSQSADLIQFFHPKAQDLQPDFSRNRQVPVLDPHRTTSCRSDFT